MAAQAAEDEARIGKLTWHSRSAEEEATWAISELESKRSRRVEMEGSFVVTLEQIMAKKVAKAIALPWLRPRKRGTGLLRL